MLLNLLKQNIETVKCPILVTFSFLSESEPKSKSKVKAKSQNHTDAELQEEATKTLSPVAKLTRTGLNSLLKNSIEDKTIAGKLCEVTVFRELNYQKFRHVIVIGIGKVGSFGHEELRQAAAAAYDTLKGFKTSECAFDLDSLFFEKKNMAGLTQAAAEGLMLASYSFDELKSKKDSAKNKTSENITVNLVSTHANEKTVKQAFENGVILGNAVNFSRRLGDLPGNLMTPTLLADSAQKGAEGTDLKVTIWDKARIESERMGGLLGVSRGSDEEPRFIIMEYKGDKSSKKPIVFVGKGLTFDCGGISIKPSSAMEEMKYDMCGGANVIGTMLAIAQLKLKINVIGLVPSTENLIGGSATKPGDVHTARNGKTFEVNNTDAEGRLILADALCYANELKPAAIFDIATLTGAIIVALGNTHTGYFTRNKGLKEKVEKAATTSGEWVWNLPLCDHHVKDMKGTFADLSNMSSGKGAGSATAAAFLEQFVGEGIPWCHFDVAGTAWAVGNRLNYCPKKGASGVMIRTFVELAKNF